MIPVLYMEFSQLPPTSNKIYFKGTILRTEARKYAEWFAAEARRYLPLISQMNDQGIFALHLRFYMTLLNASKTAKDRYKKIDLSNRVKLIEDCVRDAIGIDDSHTFRATQEKRHEPDESKHRVLVWVEEVNPADFGV